MNRQRPPEVEIVLHDGAPLFVVGARTIVECIAPSVTLVGVPPQEQLIRLSATPDGTERTGTGALIVTYATEGWAVVDRIEQVVPGQFRCERTWHNRTAASQEIVLSCALHHPGRDPFYLIPAVTYNGNDWGGGREPKGLYDTFTDPPSSWIFGGDRASIPGCTISECAGFTVALHAAPEDAPHSGCALEPATEGLMHWLWWPLQEQPRTYIRRDTYAPGISTNIRLAPNAFCSRTFFVLINAAPEPHQGYCAVLDATWDRFYHHVPARYTPQQLWTLGIRFARESLWVESDAFVGFSIGLRLDDGEWVQRSHYEIGWCGQNAGLGAMLLQDYLWHDDQESWRRGAAVLDFWATHGRFANGLFYTHFDDKLAGVTNPDLDTCNLGHGAYQYLLAAEIAEEANRPQPHWRALGLAACDFFTENALPNGKLGRTWQGDGQLKEPEGTIGCSMVWPLVKAYRLTGKEAYRQTAERAYRAYAEGDLAQLRCTAGALDTDCIDKETAFALLLPGVDLYEITDDPYYLQQATRAAYYLASWQWHYSIAYRAESPATTMAYDTFGGTSVSVQHHHLDPWGILIALGWLRLGKVSGQTIWLQRAAAAWRQATIGISDGTLNLNGILRPAGGQDEGFYHTRWSGLPGYTPGDVSDWLVAWPTAFRLITLQHWSQWTDLI